MIPLNPTDRLTVELEAQQWNQVLGLIAEGPYRVSAPLMQALQAQLQNPPAPPRNVFPMEAG
jgi:hypothetical protein